MGEAETRSIALFFFFAFLDNARAIEASTQALNLANTKKKQNSKVPDSVLVVTSTHAVWKKFHSKTNRSTSISADAGWVLPADFDFGPWREFQKLATPDELLAVIWSKVLEISESDIAKGLDITEGTIRYRLGRALRKLGSMSQGVSTKPLNAVK